MRRATSVGVQSTCSIGFTTGRRYLVYATKSPDGRLRPTLGTTSDPPFVDSPTSVPPAKPVPVRRPTFTG